MKSSGGSTETELPTVNQKMKFRVNKCKVMSGKEKKEHWTAIEFKQAMISSELASPAHQRTRRTAEGTLGKLLRAAPARKAGRMFGTARAYWSCHRHQPGEPGAIFVLNTECVPDPAAHKGHSRKTQQQERVKRLPQ